ncbi:hypothetical protein CCOS865_02076 [Pseudomonas reidholzensis]|uniref:Uncharacterized protein n=1 Tax=Pseudomonas reidholzensis TaxID=1785162 RepID=A0A383RSF9_9PSED|nr:hypothetical protein [Pseudomonas reidholzensis]SYX89815.1 hypothetical protein CCOS865_02076 [Pseudomonas reidholzensis]
MYVTAKLNPPTDAPHVFAEAYATEGLLEILKVRVARGERGILVMNCSRAQVQAVLEWCTCDDDGKLRDLAIFLVRQASSSTLHGKN